ncbi:NADH-quinone oxidoreductase subunit L [bacterium]|jgi:NADH-quinone oxidoreductase subunit L|nr:NADH-quinone oxidoreductase subunit L [bacterium]|tara:strand:+ start:7117 stop:9006 length:1890 start_codon:yes stop_codon:yes gene_type:complete
MEILLLVIVLLPLLTALGIKLVDRLINETLLNFLTINSALLSFAIASGMFFLLTVEKFEPIHFTFFTWLTIPEILFEFTLDGLSGIMMVLVTGLSVVIQIFSTSYMSQDEHYSKYFIYFNVFVFSMLLLVMSGNFLVMFFGWELVGLSSYLLISFWSKKQSAAKAGNKAFILNRIGDFGFLVGLMLILSIFGTFNYEKVFGEVLAGNQQSLDLIVICFIVGAFGKSAQFPLFSWLPDAMEGPTPASALIHAATMVTAGVFMLVRISPILQFSEIGKLTVITTGLLTALIAAFSAINQDDIKKVLAYSTISQLGFMFIAIGSGAYVAAIFHLVTHAFFKALLFLGAGAVIHEMHHEQNIHKMGNLKTRMPVTAAMMGIGTLAISGIPPLAGFWSKDEILASTFANGGIYYGFWALSLLAAFMTAFYMGRHWLLIFHKETENDVSQIKEAPKTMLRPLILLGLFSIFIGFINTPFFHGVEKVLHETLHYVEITHLPEGISLIILAVISIGAGFTGLFLAYLIYIVDILSYFKVKVPLKKELKLLSSNTLYLNKLGDLIFVRGLKLASRKTAVVVDGLMIDGLVNKTSSIFYNSSKRVSKSQTGFVRSYVVYFGFFMLLLIGLFIATPWVIS